MRIRTGTLGDDVIKLHTECCYSGFLCTFGASETLSTFMGQLLSNRVLLSVCYSAIKVVLPSRVIKMFCWKVDSVGTRRICTMAGII